MKIQEHANTYLEYCEFRKRLDKNTIKAYRIDIRQFLEYLDGKEPEKTLMESYISHLHKCFQQRTVKRKIASVKAFFNYMEEEELLEQDNVFHKIKVKFKENIILPRIIPRGDIEKLLNHLYKCKNKADGKQKKIVLRDLSIIEFFFATGARVYEISNLKRENVDLDSGSMRIMGKGGKERYVQIGNTEVLNILKEYLMENQDTLNDSSYFFVNRSGKRFTEQSIRNMLKKYVDECSIKVHITPHMFRHSFATYLIEEGVDISYVKDILGHSSIKTTQIYVHLASKQKAEILRTMHPRLKMNICAA